MPDHETTRVRRVYERDAAGYDQEIGHFERAMLDDGRAWACEQVAGDVLEIAIGTGRNLPFYPAEVRLTGIDLSSAMLAKAEERARALGRAVVLRIGDAHALDFPDETFDSVIMTLALCTIPDERRAIREAKRVLRPGGRLILLEHVRSPLLPVRLVQRLLDPLLVRWKADHLLREPLEPLQQEGFAIHQCERRKWGLIERVVAAKSPDPEEVRARRRKL
jgi:ubiquinone/menaquinone biosynthesis C-methylase UbiE